MKLPPVRVDLRLLPVAAGLWLAEALILFSSGRNGTSWIVVRTVAWSIAGCTVVGVVLARGALRRLLAVAGCALLLGCALATLRGVALGSQPLADMAKQHAVITATVELASAPTYREQTNATAFGTPDAVGAESIRWRVSANATEVIEGTRRWTLRIPVVVQGNARSIADLRELQPGAIVRFRAAVVPAQPARPSAGLLSVRGPPVVAVAAPWWQRSGASVRASIGQASSGLPEDAKGLLPGLTVGDTNSVPDDLASDMRLVGMSHLTAVSGSNLAIVTGLVLLAATRIRVRRQFAVGAAFLAMVGFVVVVGPQPSVLRSAAMASIALLALVSGRGRVGISGLLASVVLLLMVDPWLALSPGFALSVCATGGLLIWAMRRDARKGRSLGWFARARAGVLDAAGIAFAAQLATAPIVAGLGSGVALVGIPANVMAAPAVPAVTVLGLSAAIAGTVSPPLAHFLATIAGVPAGWIAWVSRTAADVPGGVIAWPGGLVGALSLGALVAVLVGVALVVRRTPPRPPQRSAAFLAAALVIAIVLFVSRPTAYGGDWPPTKWLAVMCDVGQGDATVVATAPHHALVIDAGPDPGAADQCLRDLGVTSIDMLVLTHFHADHVEGVPGLLKHRLVGRVVVSPLTEPLGEVRRVEGWLRPTGLTPVVACIGEQGSVGSVNYRVLWPRRIIRGQGSDPNNASVVLVVSVGSVRMFLTGDMEPAAQADLIAAEPPLGAQVIKIAHHGSRNQDPDLIAWSGAKLAVISVGARNRYGHPSPLTIDSWRRAGAAVARTDQNGAVAVVAEADGTPRLVTQRSPG